MVTHFNTQRLVRMELTPSGSTYKAVENEFLRLHNPDIHLTDVMEDPRDGSLLLLDTGGWFRIGCPSSLMAKSDLLGAVYRIRKTKAKMIQDPYGLGIDWEKQTPEQLVALLNDARPCVAEKVQRGFGWTIARAGETLLNQFKGFDEDAKIRTLWAVASSGAARGKVAVYEQAVLNNEEPVIQKTAINAIKTRIPNCDPEETRRVGYEIQFVLDSLLQGKAHTSIIVPLCDAISAGSFLKSDLTLRKSMLKLMASERIDASAEHALIFALRTMHFVDSKVLQTVQGTIASRRALMAFVSEAPDDLKVLADFAAKRIDSADENLARAALHYLSEYPNADSAVVQQLNGWLVEREPINRYRLNALIGSCSALIGKPEIQKIISKMLDHPSGDVRAAALTVLATQTAGATNDAWFPALDKLLAESPTPQAFDAIKKLKTPHFDAALQAIANDTKRPLAIRLKALDSAKSVKLTGETFTMVKGVLADAASSSAAKIQAAGMIASAPMPKPQLLEVAPLFATLGPVELKSLLGIVRKSKEPEVGRTFAIEIAKNPVIASQQESLYRTAFSDLPPDIFETIILPAYNAAVAATEAKKRQLGPLADKVIASGNASNGKKNFEMGKGTCIACHKIGSAGRPIGPDLSHIGAIRTERDLLESILFPSNTLARDYEAHVIETTDGQQTLGVIKSHTAEGLLVIDIAGQEKTIAHQTIAGDTILPISLMPQGLDQTMPEAELLDLVAWLRSLK